MAGSLSILGVVALALGFVMVVGALIIEDGPTFRITRNIEPSRIFAMPSPTRIFVVALVASIVAVALYTVYVSGMSPGTVTTNVPRSFSVNGKTFRFTYVATTESERTSGLMNRRITNQTTMLFAFPSAGEWSFWMYNTNTSLDMIWVNATGNTGRVVYLVTAPPCLNGASCMIYTPSSPANYVIEAKAGFAAANGVSLGTSITFR